MANIVWDVQLTRAASGWKANLRAWRVAPDSPAIAAIEGSDVRSLLNALQSGSSSICDRDECGNTLLHVGFPKDFSLVVVLLTTGNSFLTHPLTLCRLQLRDRTTTSCTYLLVAAGLDFTETNHHGMTAMQELFSQTQWANHENVPGLLRFGHLSVRPGRRQPGGVPADLLRSRDMERVGQRIPGTDQSQPLVHIPQGRLHEALHTAVLRETANRPANTTFGSYGQAGKSARMISTC